MYSTVFSFSILDFHIVCIFSASNSSVTPITGNPGNVHRPTITVFVYEYFNRICVSRKENGKTSPSNPLALWTAKERIISFIGNVKNNIHSRKKKTLKSFSIKSCRIFYKFYVAKTEICYNSHVKISIALTNLDWKKAFVNFICNSIKRSDAFWLMIG